jgi:hypothetical protein
MMYVLFAIVALLLYFKSVSKYELISGHSFELASQLKNKHNVLWGNFYFYFKDPTKVTMF